MECGVGANEPPFPGVVEDGSLVPSFEGFVYPLGEPGACFVVEVGYAEEVLDRVVHVCAQKEKELPSYAEEFEDGDVAQERCNAGVCCGDEGCEGDGEGADEDVVCDAGENDAVAFFPRKRVEIGNVGDEDEVVGSCGDAEGCVDASALRGEEVPEFVEEDEEDAEEE